MYTYALHPSQTHDKQLTHLLYIVTTVDDKNLKFWDYISESGIQGLEDTHATSPPRTTHSSIVTNHSLRFHQDLAREYAPLVEHTQLRAVNHERGGGRIRRWFLELAMGSSGKLVTRLHRARRQVKIATIRVGTDIGTGAGA